MTTVDVVNVVFGDTIAVGRVSLFILAFTAIISLVIILLGIRFIIFITAINLDLNS